MSNPIEASKLKHRVVLQKPFYTRDEMGGTLTIWQDVATLWAAIMPLRGDEAFAVHKIQARKMVKVLLRYRADITPDLRLKKGAKLFHIRAVLNVKEENNTLELNCEEIIR